MSDKDKFKILCLSNNENGYFENNWFILNKCRECKLTIEEKDFDVWISYWKSYWFACHKDCKTGMKQEAYDCQCVDSDCNDCKNFERYKTKEVFVELVRKPNGHCKLFDKPVVATNNFCSDMKCFVHRRD